MMNSPYRKTPFDALLTSYNSLRTNLRSNRHAILSKWLVGGRGELLPDLTPVWLAIEREALTQVQAERQVQQFARLDGWFRRRSGLYMTLQNEDRLPIGNEAQDGPVIAGEWSTGNGCGLAMAHDGGSWILTTTNEATEEPPSTSRTTAILPVLAENVTTLAQSGWLMHHRVYWAADSSPTEPDQGHSAIRRFCAAFAGLTRAEHETTS